MNKTKLFLCLLLILIILSGCSTGPPKHINNACSIFDEKSSWYKAANKSYKKWGVPVHVLLAIMHQESRFVSGAKPPRRTLLWFIPWTRPSYAFGYAQVKDSTWDWYKDKTGNWFADRDDFKDAVDFIGWYGNVSYNMLKISKWDAYGQYLAYHEGHGGYKRRTYLKKKWLMQVAKKVKTNADSYAQQLKKCRN